MRQATFFSLIMAGSLVFGGNSHAQDMGNTIEPGAKTILRWQKGLTPGKKRALQGEVLDRLFGQLHLAKTSRQAEIISSAIWKIWARAGGTTPQLLLQQADRAMGAGQRRVSIAILTTLIEQYPDFTEGWNRRATAYFIDGRYGLALGDIQQVLAREPRHFGALSGMGLVYQAQGQKKKALSAFRRALAIHPFLKDARRAVKRLASEVEQDI